MLTVSQKALVKACQKLKIPYDILHQDRFVVRVNFAKPLFFRHHHKPFNTSDIAGICKDKDLSYVLLHKNINIPDWKAYLAPNCNEKYHELLDFKSNEAIQENILTEFALPVIVKMNKGTQGKNVFKCENSRQILDALNTIFDRQSNLYDYIALAQKFIQIQQEFRVLAWRGEVVLMYEKNNKSAEFAGNLSPLHWKDAKAILIKDKNLIKEMQEFIAPIFKAIPIQFAGIDVALALNGDKYMLEINNAPGVAKFVEDNSIKPIEDMYIRILSELKDENNG
jgi:D-alanine-D-alanine ligase-like ATP-grasp enzyme